MSDRQMRSDPLKTEIDNGRLVVSIGIDTLCHAVSIGRDYGLGEITITDNDVFAGEILDQLLEETENGTTVVHRMLDTASSKAIEDGAEGADYDI